jgi:iron complex outermembrane receptor protein
MASYSKSWLLAATSLLVMTAQSAKAADAVAAAEPAAVTEVDAVVVTGTRQAGRTKFTTLAPVDVLSRESIQASASPSLAANLAQQIPTFIVQRLPTSDGLQFIRPATLRNLSPDQTLVLINGKRFHRSAFLGSRGAQGPDLAQIPDYAVGRIEVLRDGASAQYGSDAIAGVINIMLDDKPGFSAFGQVGQFYEGDGTAYRLGAHGGVEIGDGGHLTTTVQWSKADATSRSRQRPDAIAFQQSSGIKVDNPVQRWGDPDLKTLQFAADAALPLGEVGEAYAFGSYSKTDGVNDINWRNPAANPAIYKQVSVFPGFDLNKIYPAGFTPREGIHARDGQAVAGVRNRTSDVFTWDLSASYGQNASRFFLNNSINASMGPASPFDFNLGRLVQREANLNADAVWRLPVAGLATPLNVAFGAETRKETYRIEAGDPASYAVGPGAALGLAPNSNGFPGFSPQQAGSWSQRSYAGYLDVAADLTEKLNVDGAVRYEHFSDFGETWNGKIAGRYEFTPNVAIRASYNTGFRAPTPGQLNSTSTSQGLDTVTLQLFTTGRLSPTNPVAVFLKAQPLKPEKSKTFAGGLVWRTDIGLSGSVDGYSIDVNDRFSSSPTIVVTPAIRAQLAALGVPGASSFTSISWFTNDFDTRTRGVDVVVNYDRAVGPGTLGLTGAYNYNETKVTSGSLTASETSRRSFEESRPKNNFTGSATYTVGKVKLMARARYYGKWTDSTGNATGDIFQQFGAITFVDINAAWKVNDKLSVRVGAENVFDTHPDEAVFQASRGLVYSRNSPYDTNGGQYYARIDVRF